MSRSEQEQQLARAQEVGYLVLSHEDAGLLSAYKAWCEREQRPWVTVNVQGAEAFVQMCLEFVPRPSRST